MRRKSIIFSSIAILVALGSTSFAFNNKIPYLNIPMPGQESSNIEYELKVDTSNLPKEAMVYKFKSPIKDVDKIKDISKVFNIEDSFSEDNDEAFKVKNKDNSKYFIFEKSTGH